jgi:hypothetical protein
MSALCRSLGSFALGSVHSHVDFSLDSQSFLPFAPVLEIGMMTAMEPVEQTHESRIHMVAQTQIEEHAIGKI